MSFRNFVPIFCVLLHLTYLVGCRDDSSTTSSPAPTTSGAPNESATSPQSGQSSATGQAVEDVNTEQQRQQEAFFTAVRQGDIETISNYLNNGGDVNVTDDEGKMAFSFFIPQQQPLFLDTYKVLVNEGADTIDVNVREYGNNSTPLFFATSAKVVAKLVERGADVNAKNDYGSTPLHYPRTAEVAKALIEAGVDINAKNNYGIVPFQSYDDDVREVLVNEGADTIDVNVQNDNRTPLFFAMSAEVVEKLIERGANKLARDRDNKNPLHYARNSEVVQALIESFSSTYSIEDYVNFKGSLGETALWSFICERQGEDDENIEIIEMEKAVQALIEAGADVNATHSQHDDLTRLFGRMWSTPLECAERIGNEEIVRLLKEAGAR